MWHVAKGSMTYRRDPLWSPSAKVKYLKLCNSPNLAPPDLMQFCQNACPEPRRELNTFELSTTIGPHTDCELMWIVITSQHWQRSLVIIRHIIWIGHHECGGIQRDDGNIGNAENSFVAPAPWVLHHCIAGEILELFRSCSCGRSRGRRGIGGRGLAVVGGVAAYKIHGREELKVVCSTCIRAEEEPESHAPVRGRRRALTGLIRPQGFRWFRFFPTDEPLGMNQKPSASNSMRRRKKKKKWRIFTNSTNFSLNS